MPNRLGRPRGFTPDGAKIKRLRMGLGLTAAELARQVGHHPGSLMRIESQNRPISHVFASRLARALGVSMSDITDWKGDDDVSEPEPKALAS